MEKKYALNKKQGTLHIIGGCHISKNPNISDPNIKLYATEDDVIKENQSHFKKCKLCFKNK